MVDPFEVRMRFSSQLQHLNASVVQAQKAAQYALKYRDMCEDLHSCILEQLEKNSMNTRANIMYFIEPFLEMADKDRCEDYIRMMQRDIIRVVDAVCPEDRSGAANVKVVRKVLQGLNSKGFLLDTIVSEIEECLKDRDTSDADVGLSSPTNAEIADASSGAGYSTNGPLSGQKTNRSGAAPVKLEKRQIEQRIEEDRERHKKLRENMWQVPRDEDEAMWKFFNETSELGEDDHILGREEWEEYEKATDRRMTEENGHVNGESHP